MITVHIWVDGDDVEPCDFPEVPVVGDIIKDSNGEFYCVKSRQWDIKVREPTTAHVHCEPV